MTMNNKKYFLDFGAHLLQGFNKFLDLEIIDATFNCLSFEANPYIFAECLATKISESRSRVSSLHLINCAISGGTHNQDFGRIIDLNSCRVESHHFLDPKSYRISRKLQNQLRKARKAFKAKFFDKEVLDKKAKLDNVISTMASNILNTPPLSDSGYTFAYETEKVIAVDVIEILSSLVSPEEIVIKMDIEGAEFVALQSLLRNIDLLPYHPSVLKIYIEWHERFFNEHEKYSNLRSELELGLTAAGISVFEWV
jgi:Methyltransferase FkbM domain